MPPEENNNINRPNFGTFKIGIDPVFKGNDEQTQKKSETKITASAYNVLNNQKYEPTKNNTVLNNSDLPTNHDLNKKSIVRTYQSDINAAIQADHLSSINIAIAENQKMNEQIQARQNTPVEKSKNGVVISISFLLIIIGLVGIGSIFYFKQKNTPTSAPEQTLPALFTTEYTEELNLNITDKNKFTNVLASRLNDSQIGNNSFLNINIITSTSSKKFLINSSTFVALTKAKMPDIIKRTLTTNFMVGTYFLEKNFPFIILKTSSFENAYAGMLSWEKDIEKDLQELFRLPGYENSRGILSELAPETEVKRFEDEILANKDVRLLRDENKKIILLYGILDEETILITTSDLAFKKILDRLNQEKSLKR